MALKAFVMPQSEIHPDKPIPVEWRGYLGGIEKKTATKVTSLAVGASAADVLAKVNELIAALQTAGLMKGP